MICVSDRGDTEYVVTHMRPSSSHNLHSHSAKDKNGALPLQEKTFTLQPVQHRRQVEFSNHVHMHDLEHDFMYRNTYSNSKDDESTITDSRDIRETEINFLNNDLTRDLESNNLNSVGCHLTHVSVTVPGSTHTTDTRYKDAGHQRMGVGRRSERTRSNNRPPSPEMDCRMSDISNSDGESVSNRKFKAIKNIDPGKMFGSWNKVLAIITQHNYIDAIHSQF